MNPAQNSQPLHCPHCFRFAGLNDTTCSICQRSLLLLGRYRVRRVHRGGFSFVYIADDLHSQRRCAIKQLTYKNPQDLALAMAEVRLLTDLASRVDFVPKVYDSWETDENVFLCMEAVEGKTLHMIGELPIPVVQDFLTTSLGLLSVLHGRGIIHRDLTPNNIIQTSDIHRRYVLIDFGNAKTTTHTTNDIKGRRTDRYAAPEQAARQPTDERSDLYSLAATVVYLLTGYPPRARHERLGLPAEAWIPHPLPSHTPTALITTLTAMLALDPNERPPNAFAALTHLQIGANTHQTAHSSTHNPVADDHPAIPKKQLRSVLTTHFPWPASWRRRGSIVLLLGAVIVSVFIAVHQAPAAPARSPHATDIIFSTWETGDDGIAGPIAGQMVLESNVRYHATMSGTWNTWPSGWWQIPCLEKPEPAPQQRGLGEQTGPVGIDAVYIFAVPRQASQCGPTLQLPVPMNNTLPFEISLDNGITWNLLSPDLHVYQPSHVYIATITGQGELPQVRLIDHTTSDNYGILTIAFDPLPSRSQ